MGDPLGRRPVPLSGARPHARLMEHRGGGRRSADGAPLRTLVADPDTVAREMLARQLRDDPLFAFAGGVSHEAALLGMLNRTRPDVALIDGRLPPAKIISTVRAGLIRYPGLVIVVLADADDDPAATDAALALLRAGARGYLDRRLRPAAVLEALAGVARGELALSRCLMLQLVGRLIEASEEDTSGLRPVTSPLTDREWEVLDLLEGGLSTAQIAGQLVVSAETVRSHVKRLLRKLGVHNRADAIVAARRLRRLA